MAIFCEVTLYLNVSGWNHKSSVEISYCGNKQLVMIAKEAKGQNKNQRIVEMENLI